MPSSATRRRCASPTGASCAIPTASCTAPRSRSRRSSTLHAAQVAELREAGALGDDVRAAGHSVGEFSALRRARRARARVRAGARPRARRRTCSARSRATPAARRRTGWRSSIRRSPRSSSASSRRSSRRSRGSRSSTTTRSAASTRWPARRARRRGDRAAPRPPRRARPGRHRHPVSLLAAVARDRAAARRRSSASSATIGGGRPRRALGAERHGRRSRSISRPASDPTRSPAAASTCSRASSPSPVRWVQTRSSALVAPAAAGGLGARRIVELGPGRCAGAHRAHALDARRHRARGRGAGAAARRARPRRPCCALAAAAGAGRGRAPPRAGGRRAVRRAPAGPRPPTGRSTPGRRCASCSPARRACASEQLDDDEPLDDLFQGASSRRNQVLLDLGARARPLRRRGRRAAARRRARARAARAGRAVPLPGAVPPRHRRRRADARARAIRACRAPARPRTSRARGASGRGSTDHVLALLALETRPGPSARGGALGRLADVAPRRAPAAGRALVDRAAALTGVALGIDARAPRRPQPGRPPRSSVAARRGSCRDARADPRRQPDPAHGAARRCSTPSSAPGARTRSRRASTHRRHVRFASAWASARWDLVGAYHDGLRGDIDEAALRRIAAHGADPVLAQTARFLAGRCDGPLADALLAVAGGRRDRRPAAGLRPASRRPTAADGGRRGPRPPARPARRPSRRDLHGALDRPARPERRGRARHRRDPRLDRRRGRAPTARAAVRRSSSPRRPTRRRVEAGTATCTGCGRLRAPLHVVPANLASFTDVDALVEWLTAHADARARLRSNR